MFPASPTTLYAYLVSIGVGLKGLRVEENARRVLDALAALRGDLDGFRTHFELVGRHLGQAKDRWQDAAHRLDRFDGRLAPSLRPDPRPGPRAAEPEAEPEDTKDGAPREPAEPDQGHGGLGDEEQQPAGGETTVISCFSLTKPILEPAPTDLLEVAVAGAAKKRAPVVSAIRCRVRLSAGPGSAQVAGLIRHVDHPPVGPQGDGEHRHPERPGVGGRLHRLGPALGVGPVRQQQHDQRRLVGAALLGRRAGDGRAALPEAGSAAA